MNEAVKRKVILHYHLFKNAGSSIDALLQLNFPKLWVTAEFKKKDHINNTKIIEKWILDNQDAVAFSSHSAFLPPPKIQDVDVLPIIFLRHPIDRIASAYYFERKAIAKNLGGMLARNTSFKGYIEIRLAMEHDRQCRNLQASRLAHMFEENYGDERMRAFKSLDVLPFVGLVEQFEISVEQMGQYLKPHFPEFQVSTLVRNVNRDIKLPLEQKLMQIRAEIGNECYEKLLAENSIDLELYQSLSLRKKQYSEEIAQ